MGGFCRTTGLLNCVVVASRTQWWKFSREIADHMRLHCIVGLGVAASHRKASGIAQFPRVAKVSTWCSDSSSTVERQLSSNPCIFVTLLIGDWPTYLYSYPAYSLHFRQLARILWQIHRLPKSPPASIQIGARYNTPTQDLEATEKVNMIWCWQPIMGYET